MKMDAWVTSTRSGSNGQCTEVRARRCAVDVRDSKDPDGPILTFGVEHWAAFVASAKLGQFDR